MATKIVNRQPFSIDYDLDDINQGIFVMSEFKGICDNKNDVTIDQSTFSDANNIYVDTNNVLQSRSPIKFNDNTGHIVNQWYFGEYGIRLMSLKENNNIKFYLYCFTHQCYYNSIEKKYNYITVESSNVDSTDTAFEDQVIKITPVWIENKVFFWIAGLGIYAFNLSGELLDDNTRKPYFEDGSKYIYIPATKLVTNGLESDLEDENFLTNSYRRRYLYSQGSNAILEPGGIYNVYKSDNENRELLYKLRVNNFDTNLIVFPSLFVGNTKRYEDVDVKFVNGIPVILRYINDNIEISYGTDVFQKISNNGITCKYYKLTEDGRWIYGFSSVRNVNNTFDNRFYFCNIISETSDENQLNKSFSWEYEEIPSVHNSFPEDGFTPDEYGFAFGIFYSRTKYFYLYAGLDNSHPSLMVSATIGTDIQCGFPDIQFANPAILTIKNVRLVPNKDVLSRHDMIPFGYSVMALGNDARCKSVSDSNYSSNVIYSGIMDYRHSASDTLTDEQVHAIYNMVGSIETDVRKTSLEVAKDTLTPGPELTYTLISYCNTTSVDVVRTQFIMTPDDEYDVSYQQTLTEGWNSHVCYCNTDKDVLITDGFYGELSRYQGIPTTIILNKTKFYHNEDTQIDRIYYYDSINLYFLQNNFLWTSDLTDEILELDIYENVTYEHGSLEDFSIQITSNVPDNFTQLGDYYFSFVDFTDGQNKLLVTDTRRDEETDDFLLYLPVSSEQRFTQRINNIHPLADNMMGIFCDDAIWYIQALNLDNEMVTRYTKAIRSKLPIGNRKNDEILTADNGQAILFPTPRGIAYLSPEDFVATTDRSIKYITDAIQNFYNDFYFDDVENAYAKNKGYDIKSMIKMTTYSYWILFYKYLDSTILLLDTRSSTWWKWSVQYPIMQINGKDNLTLLMLMDKADESYHGVSFLYCDKSYNTYEDDIIANVYIGDYLIETTAYGERVIYQYADNDIDWSLTSQKLHFGAINNYKRISSVNINANGEGAIVTNYETKAFRDYYHPEDSTTVAVKINDLRTFVQRCNIMHVVNFQFGLSNYTDIDDVEPLSLNSISIKYEVKGVVR